jgi:hypothetical protein
LNKKFFENMKGGAQIFFCRVLAPAKGGKPALGNFKFVAYFE